MNVCIDIQSAIAQCAGVGRYTRTLVEHLAPLRGDDELALFYFDFKRKGLPFSVEGANQQAVRWIPGRLAQKAWKTWGRPSFNAFAGHRAGVYHFPNFILPPLRAGKSVVTVHDAAFLRFPDTLEEKNYAFLTSMMRDTLERADKIITVSSFTAKELATMPGADETKFVPIHSGLDPFFVPPAAQQIDIVRSRFGLHRPYLLHVGTLEPRKNLPFLTYVFETLDDDVDLVIAGMKGWKVDPILKRIQTSIKRSRIHCLDYVSDLDLPSLYAGAEAFVFPSLYEGFGFPPLESLRCGTPVVASTAGALPEILREGAILLEEYDVGAWTDAIHTVLTDSERRATLIEQGRSLAESYTWEATARETWRVYRELA